MEEITIKVIEYNKVTINDIEFEIPPEIIQGAYHNQLGEANQLEDILLEKYKKEIGKRRDIKIDQILETNI